MTPDREKLRIFLCYASEDNERVRVLYDYLTKTSVFDPWFDRESLLPGQDWDREIRLALRAANVVFICLSKTSVSKEGFVQREIRRALDIAEEKLESSIFIIPVRLEDCYVPERLNRWQWVDLYARDSYSRLRRSLLARAQELGITKAVDNQPSAAAVLYDSDADSFSTWTFFSPDRDFQAITRLQNDGSIHEHLELRDTRGSTLGVNKAAQTLCGRVRVEYEVFESARKLANIYACAIPMQGEKGLIEVGTDRQSHPANATSLYRVRSFIPVSYYGDGEIHIAEFSFDFRGMPTAAYTILGLRINEGVPATGPGRIRLRRIQLLRT